MSFCQTSLGWLLFYGAMTCWAGTSVSERGAPQNQPKPMWSIKLDAVPESNRKYFHGKPNSPDDWGLSFLDETRLVVHYVTHSAGGGLSSRGVPGETEPLQMHVRVLDANSGIEKSRVDLPTHTDESMLLVNNKEQILARTGGVLRLYDLDFSVLRERALPHKAPYDQWQLAISPSGKTLLIAYYRPSISEIEILDSSNFRILAKWTDSYLGDSFSISDTGVVRPDADQRNILMRSFGEGDWQVLAGRPTISCINRPTFVTDSVVLAGCREVFLLGIDGKLLMKDDFGEHVHVGRIAVSQEGNAAVLAIAKTKESFFDVPGRLIWAKLAIYDISSKSRKSTLNRNPSSKVGDEFVYDFAISPDGRKLAVMDYNVVTVYEIEQSDSHKSADLLQ